MRRALATVLTLLVAAVASIAWAVAAPVPATAAPVLERAPGGACSLEEWQKNMDGCVQRLAKVGEARANCLNPPQPSTPDSGLAGWFAERPKSSTGNSFPGLYSDYGYAGYSYTTYDLDNGCASTLIDPEYKFETTVANGEFMIATAIVGAANALRERAWDPETLWGWADPLVAEATKAVYEKVFSVFGVVTLAVVGLYLIWRSRQAEMGAMTTTAGWAILVMVAVTAIAAWPVRSANMADQTLISTLSVVHDAVGPRPERPPAGCSLGPAACKDNRPPAVRASDTATETMLYRNWLRGLLGSADSQTAKKYGPALYDARSLSWEEAKKLRDNPATRDATLERKKDQWERVAEQVKTEDPEAYEYLKGVNGMDRVGSGFIAMLASLMFALFDLTASLLVLLGFLIFRWAVIAAPILGTIGLLRPANAGIKRLGNAVVAAIFNIAIFGTGSAIYLFAVDLIMNTASLAGWLQVVLVFLCGLVGWVLLRPYTRITQLGGKNSTQQLSRLFEGIFARRGREYVISDDDGKSKTVFVDQVGGPNAVQQRPETRNEDPSQTQPGRKLPAIGRREQKPETGVPTPRRDGTEMPAEDVPAKRQPTEAGEPAAQPRRTPTWSDPDVAERPASYAIYRPETGSTTREPSEPRVRTEAK
ncbi:MFS transporter [Actinoplanes sp. NPDC051470]|uniref:MFS transporter n=1 Tax=Actinoplanes sp. NPDC051470 TaxID=3157224 RepID=UPI003417B0AB